MTLEISTREQDGRLGAFSPIRPILDKASREESLSKDEIFRLLCVKRPEEIEELFGVARELRRRYYGNRVFLYGFVYFSTWCRNRCTFCSYRAGNRFCRRYRKTEEQIFKISLQLVQSGVHLLDFTMGEDPFYYEAKDGFFPLIDLVKRIKDETGTPVMISWGVLSPEILEKLADAGSDWYACYQETHSRELFSKLRPLQDYDRRLCSKAEASRLGLLIEEGVLSGAGETLREMADSLDFMRRNRFSQVRVMNFVPQEGTPMARSALPDPLSELVTIAIMRLLIPRSLIPASLDVYGLNGLQEKLDAGANVVTSLIAPESGLNGVVSTLDISTGNRTVQAVVPVLRNSGWSVGKPEDYILWIKGEKERLNAGGSV